MTPFNTGRSSPFIKLIDIDWVEMLERYGIVDTEYTGDLEDFEGMDLVLRYDYNTVTVMGRRDSLYTANPMISSSIDCSPITGRRLSAGGVYELDKSQAMKVVTYLLVKSL